jgi:hypothetical protein
MPGSRNMKDGLGTPVSSRECATNFNRASHVLETLRPDSQWRIRPVEIVAQSSDLGLGSSTTATLHRFSKSLRYNGIKTQQYVLAMSLVCEMSGRVNM